MFITTHNLSYSYEDSAVAALDDLTLAFAEGWTGLVGNNGAGKSTLAELICGKLKAAPGAITPIVQGIYCAQSTEEAPDNLEDFALDYSSHAMQLRSLLGIEDEWLWRYGSLSHGEMKRIQIGCALLLEPPVLALDEPSNHLDAETRDMLLRTLKEYRGVGILISHDRTLLDALVYQCIFMNGGKASAVPGSYSQGKAELDHRHASAISERRNAKEELARVNAEATRRKTEASRASSRRSARNLDKHDSDGRAKIGLAIFTGQDGKTGLLSAQMDKKKETVQKRLDSAYVEKSYDKLLDLVTEPAKRKVLWKEDAGSLPMGENTLFYPDMYIGNTDHIGLQGRNGTGKSSFFNHLIAGFEDADRLVVIPQEMTEREGRALLQEVKSLSSRELGQVLSIVARLNSPPERILAGDNLSPGELRKVMLACGLLKQPYLIAMDEPTNHLDIHSIEALQGVLAGCNCALLLVSHDAPFIEALTNIRWIFAPKTGGAAEGEFEITVELH